MILGEFWDAPGRVLHRRRERRRVKAQTTHNLLQQSTMMPLWGTSRTPLRPTPSPPSTPLNPLRSPIRNPFDTPSTPLRSPFDSPSIPLRGPFDPPSTPLRTPFDPPFTRSYDHMIICRSHCGSRHSGPSSLLRSGISSTVGTCFVTTRLSVARHGPKSNLVAFSGREDRLAAVSCSCCPTQERTQARADS